MLILNFLIVILIPYFSFLNKLTPPDTIPIYFDSNEAAFVAGEFFAVAFFWAGFLRNRVYSGELSEQHYFGISFLMLIFICASKIIFTMPFAWIISMFAFGLGVLAAPEGQTITERSVLLVKIISVLIFFYATFILIGMAWFNFNPSDYYYFKLLMHDNVVNYINDLKNKISLYL
jgi:hypothetical protein